MRIRTCTALVASAIYIPPTTTDDARAAFQNPNIPDAMLWFGTSKFDHDTNAEYVRAVFLSGNRTLWVWTIREYDARKEIDSTCL